MEKEEAIRLISMYGTCLTCGAPQTTVIRWDTPRPGEVTEELTCSADPDWQDERHQRGEILLGF